MFREFVEKWHGMVAFPIDPTGVYVPQTAQDYLKG